MPPCGGPYGVADGGSGSETGAWTAASGAGAGSFSVSGGVGLRGGCAGGRFGESSQLSAQRGFGSLMVWIANRRVGKFAPNSRQSAKT